MNPLSRNRPLSDRRRKEIASLAQRKYRTRLRQTIVEGIRAVTGAAAAGAPIVEVVATHEAVTLPEVASFLQQLDAPLSTVDHRTMQRLTDVETSQGLLAVVETRLEDLQTLRNRRRVLALDGVQDPGNVGTLVRTALWFGIDAVLAGPGTVDFFSPKVVRATMSALWEANLYTCDALGPVLSDLRSAGFAVYAADLSGIDARSWHPTEPSALILGNEANGMSPPVRALADEAVTIPGTERTSATDSLNVATAGAVLMYQWTR